MYKYFPAGNHFPALQLQHIVKIDFRISHVAVSGCALLTPQSSKRIAQLGMLNLSALFAFPIRLVAYFRIAPGPGGLAGDADGGCILCMFSYRWIVLPIGSCATATHC